jgi:integrase
MDPRTRRRKEVKKVYLDTEDPDVALERLRDELLKIRQGESREVRTLPPFSEYAASLLERKLASGEIKSGKSVEVWGTVLENHLIPVFGEYRVDQITKLDVEEWKSKMGRLVQKGEYAPTTINNLLKYLRVVLNAACADCELERNPIMHVKDLDASEHHTYTEEQPNSLRADEMPKFLSVMRDLYPQHFAFVALGFATGLRPSHIRPLRRRGATPDVNWEQGTLLVRRSETAGKVMNTTKTNLLQKIGLPEDLMSILRWQADRLEASVGPMRDSDLLFPSETGGFRAASCLDRPFDVVAEKIGLEKSITARAMRRTFNDLCRRARVESVVTRSISGHATEQMKQHYETVNVEEKREGLAKVISLAGFRQAFHGNVGAPDSASSAVAAVGVLN